MSAAARVGRFYTAARRHPWVLGKVGDWKIPLGPYTPAQIAVGVVGGFVLVKTISWWSVLGPVPITAWLLTIWVVRRPRIRGRAPMQAALGWMLLGWQPQGGRIGGRAARDRAARPLLGAFTIEDAPRPAPPAPSVRPAPRPAGARSSMPRRTKPVAPAAAGVGPMSGVQQLLSRAGQSGGVR
ncbi:hypothetical protein [Streptomyces sp. NBC_00140]|uniref:hypothetical protein n=1 Tax=Streptomyces sp. NBC_00140 TaxID=2975664 RepID=UPI00225A2419|nr:hypothetical protein [Streptomyces sp. NBC_00140]MCX5327790.1 hypothetical protein [Streptomyces sp. NBC_00140]MCX5336843.1 hypothetical protein [Streptomyces sp. NBC_00140]